MEVKSIIERDESGRKRDKDSYSTYYGKGEPLETQRHLSGRGWRKRRGHDTRSVANICCIEYTEM